MPNALDLLKQDHDKVRKLLAQLTDTTNQAEKTRQDLLAKIKQEMKIHTQLEEEIFYPAFKEADGQAHAQLYYEALEEHHIVEDVVIEDVEGSQTRSDAFAGRARVLREQIEHHASEEEKDIFAKARDVFSKDELEELGRRMEARKKELQG